MDISRSNIEYYLTLYFERKLDPIRTAELMMFLSENPDLESLIEIPGNLTLHSDDVTFPGKEILRKNFSDFTAITAENFDEFCIASAEGLLDEGSEKKLQEYISDHPEKEKDARIYSLMKVKADANIRYTGKSMLKKPVPWHNNRMRWIMMSGVAAAIALIVMMITGRPEGNLQPDAAMVQNQALEGMQESLPAQQPDPMYETRAPALAVADQPTSNTHPLPATEDYQISANLPQQAEILLRENMEEATDINAPSVSLSEMSLESIAPHHQVILASPQPAEETSLAYNRETTGRSQNTLRAGNDLPERDTDAKGLISFIRDLDAWSTAQYALKGFNVLTESSLSLDKTTDEQGKITGLIIGTEAYTLLAKSSEQGL